jgi:oligopeptide transport system ATP-binding protein
MPSIRGNKRVRGADMAQTLLDVQGLQTHFHTDGGLVKAVDGVDLKIEAGGILGLVGESGSGKSVTGLTIMRLLGTKRARVAGGRVHFKGRDLLTLSDREVQALRGSEIGMVFQGALTGLDPSFRVGSQMIEVIRRHQGVSKIEARRLALESLDLVGMPDPERKLRSYSHELSGGQRQRVLIAMALSGKPDLLIADEPTTALDATVQKQIVDLLIDINRTLGTAILMVTHDFGVVARMCRSVAVMRHGRVVEQGTVHEVLTNPQHVYTESLMKAVPRLHLTDEERTVPRSERRLFELRPSVLPEAATAAVPKKETVHVGK